MKKQILALALAFGAMTGYAQTNPERIIIHKKDNTYAAFLAERVDSITFPTIEGEVKASVEVLSYEQNAGEDDLLTLKVTRTPECYTFKLDVLPKSRADALADEVQAAYYLDSYNETTYNSDFTSGQVQGLNLVPDATYVVMTLGFDKYGAACSVSRAEFTTPKKALEGNPQVSVEIANLGTDHFTVNCTPNDDTYDYAIFCSTTGSLEQQFQMFGPMFGFANLGDMIWGWGAKSGVDFTNDSFDYTGMTPGTDYEVFVIPRDANETLGEYTVTNVTTQKLGGEGTAGVSVLAGSYTYDEASQTYTQTVNFTPNDQTAAWRYNVALAANYDTDPEGYKSEIPVDEDPMFPMVGWYNYGTQSYGFEIQPSTEYVVLTAGKNANGEWSPVEEFRFTTPATAENAPASAPRLKLNATGAVKPAAALGSAGKTFQPGRFPSFLSGLKTGKPVLKQN